MLDCLRNNIFHTGNGTSFGSAEESTGTDRRRRWVEQATEFRGLRYKFASLC